MDLLRRATEGLARKTSRRGLFGRGAEVVTGALFGAAAGTLAQAGSASAGPGTVCFFPARPALVKPALRAVSVPSPVS